MSTREPEAKYDEARPRERRRLKLIESYGAFSDDRLQEVAQKIRGITSDNDTPLTAPKGESPFSSGEITESLTQCPLGETDGIKEHQSFEKSTLIDKKPEVPSPNGSPNGSPDDSPIGSPDGSPMIT